MKILRSFALIQFLSALIFLAGCSGSSESNTANTNAANAKTPIASPSIAAGNANAPVAVASPTVQPSEGSSAPCAIVTAHHAALVRRDEVALRKTLTQATIRQFEADAKAEGEKTIVGYLTAYSSPSAKPPVCGGTVQGDAATLQVKEGDTGVVSTWKAAKENGEWKLDLLDVQF
ncbi:MAG: hypothetical protein M3209_19745 [Acidobacteriota bacterium]|nr:hypothetical protein [Acidobacteriota bacterium]